jgi:hypothetical protein
MSKYLKNKVDDSESYSRIMVTFMQWGRDAPTTTGEALALLGGFFDGLP